MAPIIVFLFVRGMFYLFDSGFAAWPTVILITLAGWFDLYEWE